LPEGEIQINYKKGNLEGIRRGEIGNTVILEVQQMGNFE
jgi:hypothetical protein